MTELVMELKKGNSREALSKRLNQMSHQERLQEVYGFGPKEQALLYEAAHLSHPGRDDYFVPKTVGEGIPVQHWGINSLPMFRKFKKTMCRNDHMPAGTVAVGYNEQLLKAITGPGYFVVGRGSNPDGVEQDVVDYTILPAGPMPDGWPKIIPNSARLSRFIYNNTQDWMWKVSEHVSIGRASRGGQWLDNWFILVRQD